VAKVGAVVTHIALLRGVNLGARNRIAMPALRDALSETGFDDVRTYLQSGNVVLTGGASSEAVARKVRKVIADRFGLDVDVVVRTRAELAAIVERDPLGEVAKDPKRYQVSFLASKPRAEAVHNLEEAAIESERLVVQGREAYAWHPNGIGRSKLAAVLAGNGLGVSATARNWTTVTKLLAIADD
jgi:uncharacterized protein (DUF1697 family)